jgi:hypothetical protein
MDPRYRNHRDRVLARRAALARGEVDSSSSRRKAKAGTRPTGKQAAKAADDDVEEPADEQAQTPPARTGSREDALATSGGTSGSTPRVGAKPSNKRNPGSRPSGNRPGGNRRR